MSANDSPEEPNESPLVLHNIPHIRQRSYWDCGVTCVLMLLSAAQRKHFLNNFNEICREEGFHQSTWTIDLCYLLMRFGIPHTLYTTMPGVNEEHQKQTYYSKIIELDRGRVSRRFAQAARAGVRVRARGATQAELLRQLRRGPALLLVDAGLLACDLCRRNRLRVELRRWFGGGYRGHYIVCVGARGSLILFQDPAHACSARSACAAPAERVLRAHHAPGTDSDAIFIHKTYR